MEGSKKVKTGITVRSHNNSPRKSQKAVLYLDLNQSPQKQVIHYTEGTVKAMKDYSPKLGSIHLTTQESNRIDESNITSSEGNCNSPRLQFKRDEVTGAIKVPAGALAGVVSSKATAASVK